MLVISYCLQVRYSLILGSQNVFLAARAEITNQLKSKQIIFHRGDFMYHRFLETAWLAVKYIYKYLTIRQYQNSGKFCLNIET
jgi:hypothetical protein